jgi:putative ABC transport system permease protein
MTILHIAISNLRQRKLKSILVMLGLAIGIATIVSVYGILETMKSEMTRQMEDYGANILITADTGEITYSYGGITIPGVLYEKQLTTEDVSDLERLKSREMIKAIVPKLLGAVTTLGNEVTIAGTDIQSEFSIKPWLRIVDFLASTKEPVNAGDGGSAMEGEKLNLDREDYTRIELNDNEVILGSGVAYTLGLFPSNRLVLNDKEFTIKAILEKNGAAEDNQVLMNLAAAQAVLGYSDQVTTIELSADFTLGSEEQIIQEIETLLPEAKVTSLLRALRDRDEVADRIAYFGFSVSVIILLSGMLVAGLGMTSAIRDRTREIGILRAIGFRKSYIRKIIFLEGIMVSAAGGLLGFAAGTVLARVLIPMLTETYLAVPWRLDSLVGSILIALAIGSIASVYPAQQAAKLDPAESLRFI